MDSGFSMACVVPEEAMLLHGEACSCEEAC
jgi:hypothetical protein